jgi:transposase
MIKTYTLSHDLHLDKFFLDYNHVLNKMISEIWDNIIWIEKPKKNSKQKRIFPSIPSYAFKKAMRDEFFVGWQYASHWIDSAIKTAFSIINSWKKNYNKGRRKRNKPVVKQFYVRVREIKNGIKDRFIIDAGTSRCLKSSKPFSQRRDAARQIHAITCHDGETVDHHGCFYWYHDKVLLIATRRLF